MSLKADVQLDAKGLACPMPIVKTKKAMDDLIDGQILEVVATDKGSKADLAAWADSVGHQFIGTIEEEDILKHYIRKCSNEIIEEQPFEHTISISELQTLKSGVLLDVREEVEYAFGHIEGAKSIPLGELEDRLNELDKEQEIYIVCRTGKRSDLAASKLAANGFTKVFNVVPGMTSWKGNLSKNI
ncbi:rhodanese-related sulfurtransferase [Ureibacillus xyleni]|uniref:Rhodanese-related sulfurtransferase n=1 Tax=Ureibacillus xyleni TaxID=614648 RepID=A0A285TNE3_9BACL|nr:sulfurtransferase TusA family protein [Ureibacillus xyleni]SOC24025.1 rhodanese-related sulfurtransferase [Ureibacillus xyleni]